MYITDIYVDFTDADIYVDFTDEVYDKDAYKGVLLVNGQFSMTLVMQDVGLLLFILVLFM